MKLNGTYKNLNTLSQNCCRFFGEFFRYLGSLNLNFQFDLKFVIYDPKLPEIQRYNQNNQETLNSPKIAFTGLIFRSALEQTQQ